MLSSLENSNCWKVLSHITLQSDFTGCLPDPLPGADLGNPMGCVSGLASGILVTIRDFLSASLVWLLFLVPSRFPPATIPDPFPWWFPAYICAPITKFSPEMKSEHHLLKVARYYISQSVFPGTPALCNATPKVALGT